MSAVEFQVILETIIPANLLTGAKHPAFSTNHMTDIDKTTTKNDTRNLHDARRLLTYAYIKAYKSGLRAFYDMWPGTESASGTPHEVYQHRAIPHIHDFF